MKTVAREEDTAAHEVGPRAEGGSGSERLRRPAFYVLVLVTGYLAYLVVSPFLAALTWAAIFAMLCRPVQLGLEPRVGQGRAALITTILVAVLIVGPAVMVVAVLAQEVPRVAEYIQQLSVAEPQQIDRLWTALRSRSPVPLPQDPTVLVREGLQRVLAFLAPRAGAVVADLLSTIGSLFAMLFAFFFMLRDGDRIGRELRALLPLPRDERERLMRQTRDLVVASVGAGLAVAVVQGALGGLSFWIVGIGAPVFWGVVIAFCSLIPVFGAAMVWVPAALWLLLSGAIGRGVTLIVIGALGISMADNVLRPLLLSGRSSVNGLVIFFGLLGGVSAFGFVGLVLGPIVLVVTFSLIRMFARPDLVERAR